MQFKSLFTLASLVALVAAAPGADMQKRNEQVTLTTHFTTETFTATRVLQSIRTKAPFVTTITTNTVWTVAHTVTQAVPTGAPQSQA